MDSTLKRRGNRVKLIISIAHGNIYLLEYLRDQYWVQFLLSDLLLIAFELDIVNYPDGNSYYLWKHENVDELIVSSQDAAARLLKWFSDSQMKGNTDECHLLLSKDKSSEIHVGESISKNSNCEKLLGVKIDSKLCSNDHVQDLCQKSNRKLRATPFMHLNKKRL